MKSNIHLLLLILLILLSTLLIFVLALFWYSPLFWRHAYKLILLRLLFIGASLYLISRLFYFRVIINDRMKDRMKSLAVMVYTLIALFLFGEGLLMFLPRSHNMDHTLASKIWYKYYWHPINSHHYRDVEPDFRALRNKRKVFVLGDSFAAGHGIRDFRDRFSDRLAEKMPDDYHVCNLGLNGSDTKDAYSRLTAFPVQPDILILQHFGNDIEKSAVYQGIRFQGFDPYDRLNPVPKAVIRTSFLLNFIYWRMPRQDISSYKDFLMSAYGDPYVLEEHLSDLDKIIDHCEQREIPLIAVLFPIFPEPELSAICMEPVKKHLILKGVPVIDVRGLVKDMPVEARVVNANDIHPSVTVHERVAKALYQTFQEKGLLGRVRSDP
jgi:lysophospholipase L1-like esterase